MSDCDPVKANPIPVLGPHLRNGVHVIPEEEDQERLQAQLPVVPPVCDGYIQDSTEVIKKHESVAAPIGKLPPELLCQIFFEAANSPFGPRIKWEDRSVLPQEPFNVCLVSRYWNDLASGDASLWSRIVLNLDADIWPSNFTELLQRYLDLSGDVDLSLVLVESTPIREDRASLSKQLKSMVLGFSERVIGLTIAAFCDPFRNVEADSKPVTFPNLSQFTYDHLQKTSESDDGPDVSDDNSEGECYEWIEPSTPLSVVQVWDPTLDDHLRFALAELTDVRTLQCCSYDLDQSFKVIDPHLATLKVLAIEVDSDPVDGFNEERIFPSLNELYVDFTRPSATSQDWLEPFPPFWDHIICPSLHTLYIGDTDEFDQDDEPRTRTWNREVVGRFIERGGLSDTLTRLLISSTFFTSDDAIHTLTLLPNLLLLSLYKIIFSDNTIRGVRSVSLRLIRFLTPSIGDAAPTLPRLLDLRIPVLGAHELPERIEALSEMLRRRHDAPGVHNLRALHLWVDPTPTGDEISKAVISVRDAELRGLRIRIGRGSNDTNYYQSFQDLVSISRRDGLYAIP